MRVIIEPAYNEKSKLDGCKTQKDRIVKVKMIDGEAGIVLGTECSQLLSLHFSSFSLLLYVIQPICSGQTKTGS